VGRLYILIAARPASPLGAGRQLARAEPSMTNSARSVDPFLSLPVVDVSALVEADSGRLEATVAALRRAASDVGFLYVTGHGVPSASVAALERVAREFFALPSAAKLEYYIGRSKNHRGYVPPGEEVFYSQTKDTKEAFDLSRDLPDGDYGAASRLLGPNVWPRELPEFRSVVSSYYEQVFALGRALLRGFALALELPGTYFDGYLQRPPSQLRLIHYQPAESGVDSMGIGAHTDYECLTILHATSPGLQVINGAGQWVAAPPVPGAFVVNIGDLLEVWSNGTFISTSHRVLPVPAARYSFPLFFTVDYETRVEPLPHLPPQGKRYTPLVSGEHLLAQTMQSFRYMVELRERGELALPDGSRELSSFGRERTSV
jgi:isopenicillin N synthase-like dioxygenase